jgi:hypothetical protein
VHNRHVLIAVLNAVVGASWLFHASDVEAAGSVVLSYGGRFTETNGKPVDGPVDIEVAFFPSVLGGSLLRAPLQFPNTKLTQGLFQISIELDPSDFHAVFAAADSEVWIEVRDVTHGVTYPRQRFGVVPYALKVPVDGESIDYDDRGRLSILPASAPGAGEFLTKNGSGELIWQKPSAGILQGQRSARRRRRTDRS